VYVVPLDIALSCGSVLNPAVFGDLPLMGADDAGLTSASAISLTVDQVGLSAPQGASPFTTPIVSAAVRGSKVTAIDAAPGGLSTGVYETVSSFSLLTRDEFSNRVLSGYLPEVQILTLTDSGGTPAGAFTLSFAGSMTSLVLVVSRQLPSGVVPFPGATGVISDFITAVELQHLLEAVPTITGALVTRVLTASPHAAEYAITFTSEIGDVEALVATPQASLTHTTLALTACDAGQVQIVSAGVDVSDAADPSFVPLAGTFTLASNSSDIAERTPALLFDNSASVVAAALAALPSFTSRYTVVVTRTAVSSAGGYAWAVSVTPTMAHLNASLVATGQRPFYTGREGIPVADDLPPFEWWQEPGYMDYDGLRRRRVRVRFFPACPFRPVHERLIERYRGKYHGETRRCLAWFNSDADALFERDLLDLHGLNDWWWWGNVHRRRMHLRAWEASRAAASWERLVAMVAKEKRTATSSPAPQVPAQTRTASTRKDCTRRPWLQAAAASRPCGHCGWHRLLTPSRRPAFSRRLSCTSAESRAPSPGRHSASARSSTSCLTAWRCTRAPRRRCSSSCSALTPAPP